MPILQPKIFSTKKHQYGYRANRELLYNLNFCVWRLELIFSKKNCFCPKKLKGYFFLRFFR